MNLIGSKVLTTACKKKNGNCFASTVKRGGPNSGVQISREVRQRILGVSSRVQGALPHMVPSEIEVIRRKCREMLGAMPIPRAFSDVSSRRTGIKRMHAESHTHYCGQSKPEIEGRAYGL